MTKEEIDELIEQNILDGNRRTTAAKLREVLYAMNANGGGLQFTTVNVALAHLQELTPHGRAMHYMINSAVDAISYVVLPYIENGNDFFKDDILIITRNFEDAEKIISVYDPDNEIQLKNNDETLIYRCIDDVGTWVLVARTDKPDVSGKENITNKTDSITGNEASSTLYSSIKGIVDYFTTTRIKTILGQASASVSGFLSSVDWNTFNNKQNALGFTPENAANKGVANGYAPLNASTKIDLSYLPDAILGQLLYGGIVDASTAIASLSNNAKTKLGTALTSIT